MTTLISTEATTGTATAAGRTRALLAAGVAAGPLFTAVVAIQALTRTGFDPKKHPLSLLSLGDLGWIQIANFVVCGLLALASAFALRRVLRPGRGGTWAPILVGVYGVCLVWGGVFLADPAFGFPPDSSETISWHGILHSIAPAIAGLVVPAACFVFARRYAGLGRRGWAWSCVVTAGAGLALTWSSFPAADFRLMLAGQALGWILLSAVTGHLLADRAPARTAEAAGRSR